MIKKPGRIPTRSEQLLFVPLVPLRFDGYDETVVIHHITEDTVFCLQLEIERRVSIIGETKCFFERVWI